MKKLTAAVLVGLMAMNMTNTAFAATLNPTGQESGKASYSFDIHAKKSASLGDSVSVISVDLTYGAMNFIYSEDTTSGVWNPDNHTFDTGLTTGSWAVENQSNEIKVTNHSNRNVKVDLSAVMSDSAITPSFGSEHTCTLNKGVVNKYSEADNKIFKLTLTGTPASVTEDNFSVVGSVTVAIEGQES